MFLLLARAFKQLISCLVSSLFVNLEYLLLCLDRTSLDK